VRKIPGSLGRSPYASVVITQRAQLRSILGRTHAGVAKGVHGDMVRLAGPASVWQGDLSGWEPAIRQNNPPSPQSLGRPSFYEGNALRRNAGCSPRAGICPQCPGCRNKHLDLLAMHETKETPAATNRLYNPKRRLMEQSDRQITFETEVTARERGTSQGCRHRPRVRDFWYYPVSCQRRPRPPPAGH